MRWRRRKETITTWPTWERPATQDEAVLELALSYARILSCLDVTISGHDSGSEATNLTIMISGYVDPIKQRQALTG